MRKIAKRGFREKESKNEKRAKFREKENSEL